MTTIAIKDGILACEGKETHSDGFIVSWNTEKVLLHNDAYYGFCGSTHHIFVVMDTIKADGELTDVPPDITLQFIKMPKKGPPLLLWLENGHLTQEVIGKEGMAIGSGMNYAMVAMSCGNSAVEAVKTAIQFDCFSGGKVKSYSFNKPKAVKKAKKVEVGVFDDWEEVGDEQ